MKIRNERFYDYFNTLSENEFYETSKTIHVILQKR